ncbi:MAG TPA: hypothetical protein VIV57_15495, partial [Anaeromyxobacter sp.]
MSTPAERAEATRLAIALDDRREAAEAEGRDLDYEADMASSLPMAERSCSEAALRARQALRLVSLADLPEGCGWGEQMDELTGGGLAPGDVVGIGAPATGAGKTALLAQVLDGLAHRSALTADDPEATAPVTPVMLISEMDAADLECRTLGRLLSTPGTMFTAGESAKRWNDWGTVATKFDAAAALMAPGGAYSRLCRWQHTMRAGTLAGPTLLNAIEEHGEQWIARIRRDLPGRQIVPVLALDPINSVLPVDEGRSEVETLGEMSAALDAFVERLGWIALMTVETNKASARADEAPTNAAAVYRSTMQLLHRCDLALVLVPGEAEPDGVRPVSLIVDKNRRGRTGVAVPFRWHTRRGLRFVPDDPTIVDAQERERAERKTRGERLRALAERLAVAGEELTERRLERGLHKEVEIPRRDLVTAVTHAIE